MTDTLELGTARGLDLPRWPRAWYVVARGSDIPRGGVRHGTIADRAYVIFRARSGELAALDAHCPHMGAHLRHGQVVENAIECPLHEWRMDPSGRCTGPGALAEHRARTWPLAERFGLVFLYPGTESSASIPPPLPAPENADELVWTVGTPQRLETDWRAMMVNGLDMLHLAAVHRRELVGEPHIGRTSDGSLRLEYTSRVIGTGLSDRLMKSISKDRIRARQTCRGPTVVVEVDLGRTRSCAVFGLLPGERHVLAFGAFGVPRGPLSMVRAALAKYLYLAFLRRDFGVVEDMQLRLDRADSAGIVGLAAYLRGLEELDVPSAGA